MVFEILQVLKNEPLRLIRWVKALHPGLRIFHNDREVIFIRPSSVKQNNLQTKDVMSRSNIDTVHNCNMILRMLQVVENEPFGLAQRMATREQIIL